MKVKEESLIGKVSEEMNLMLYRLYEEAKILAAMKMMYPLKAPGPDVPLRWNPPTGGFIKMNVNVGVAGPSLTGLGIIFCAVESMVLACASKCTYDEWDSYYSEALVVAFGLRLAIDLVFPSLMSNWTARTLLRNSKSTASSLVVFYSKKLQ
ncbi:hypothetical protein GH714_041405 [Hevea brasiliensis]|uniref:Uncharacterized protein n=1 Tax=Hevea brasiliensis TaxID=3981 RepID=A0A6A6N0H9_HEVBR|nr:hypothetical protein GH714_041405 [Hevea brasiliensis]